MNSVNSLATFEEAADSEERVKKTLPVVHIVGIGTQPGPSVRSAVAKAGGQVVIQQFQQEWRDLPRLAGSVLIIEARSDDICVHLFLSDIRGGTDARIILILPHVSPEASLMARLHGADHVVGSDIDPRELAAIVRNELRSGARSCARARAGEELHRWHLDGERWSLIAPNHREVRLTHSEFGLLQILIDEPGLVQSRCVLRAAIDGDPSHARVLDTVISRLRRKVWDCAHMELPLRSARGEGYVFASNGLV